MNDLKRIEFSAVIESAITCTRDVQTLLEIAAELNDSVGLTLVQHEAQNLLDRLRNLKQHNEAD